MEGHLRIIGLSGVWSDVVPPPPAIILLTWPDGEFRKVLGDLKVKCILLCIKDRDGIWGQIKDSCYVKGLQKLCLF